MNVLKKQLKIPTSLTGMKKAVSITNLSDNSSISWKFSPMKKPTSNGNMSFKLSKPGQQPADKFDWNHPLSRLYQRSNSTSRLPGILSSPDRAKDHHGSTHNLTMDSKSMKSKSPSFVTQEISETLQSLSYLITDKTTKIQSGNFIADDLPTTLSTDWLANKYSVNHTKQMQQKTSAIIELLTTELNYLNQMQFLLDISAKIFTQIQPKYFPYIQMEDVFLNLGDIYEVNYQFWLNYLYPSYENALNNNEFIFTKYWKEGFKDMASLFFPYQIYCAKMTQCQKYIQALEKDNKYFSQFSQWFSHLEQANRESLTDFIAKPFQRLTKYKLLLNTIGKFSQDLDEQKDFEEMGDSVNLFLKQVELKISIAQISMRVDPIEIVEPPTEDLQELCVAFRNFDLTTPIQTINGEIIREMKKEAVFKLKEAQTKVCEVSCLLFTDLILICQKIKNPETDRIKIIKPIISLKKMDMLNPLPGALVIRVIDDFGCLSAMYLLTNEPLVINEWMDSIHSAKITLKDINSGYHFNDLKTYLKPRLNVISSSPIPEGSITPISVTIPTRSTSPQTRSLNRSPGSFNTSFIRSNFRSSPVIRKRVGTVAKRNHLSLSEEQSPHEIHCINRSLSQQHSSKSHLSILEDDLDGSFMSKHSSIYSEDFRSSNLSIQSESIENLDATLSTNQNNDLHSNNDAFQTNEQLNFNSSNNLKDSRAYKSMMDLIVDS